MGTGDGGASPSDTGQSGTGTGRGPSPTHEILTKLKLTTATNRIFLLIKVAAMPHVASATAGVLAGFFWRAAWLLTPLRKGLPASGPTQGASALSAPQAKLISIEWAAPVGGGPAGGGPGAEARAAPSVPARCWAY
jgi:hypothetical protein